MTRCAPGGRGGGRGSDRRLGPPCTKTAATCPLATQVDRNGITTVASLMPSIARVADMPAGECCRRRAVLCSWEARNRGEASSTDAGAALRPRRALRCVACYARTDLLCGRKLTPLPPCACSSPCAAGDVGTWLLYCDVHDHYMAGMMAQFEVTKA